jgi:hypothetical protein
MAKDSDKEIGTAGNRGAGERAFSSNTPRKASLYKPVIQPTENKAPFFRRTPSRIPGEAQQPDHDWLTGEGKTFREEPWEQSVPQPQPHTGYAPWVEPEARVPLKDEGFFDSDDGFNADHNPIDDVKAELRQCKRLQWLLLCALLIATAANVMLLMI